MGLSAVARLLTSRPNFRNHFIRHSNFELWIAREDVNGTGATEIEQFHKDASFKWTSPGLAAATTGGDLSAEAQALLAQHNGYRAKHCVPRLSWSNQLAAEAQGWANGCKADGDGKFLHSATSDGESLAWGKGLSASGAVDFWYSEINNYDFDAPRVDASTGHFTQLVWRDSSQVGCAVNVCGSRNYWVCRYSPPGNFNVDSPGELERNVPPPCK